MRATARGKGESLEFYCLVLTTNLPTYNLAKFVRILKTADAPMNSPLSKKPNLTLFLGPLIFIVMDERAKSARSLGAALVISSYFTPFIYRV